ncbi:MAG: hypothetical protein QM582_03785 [Micropruina sp.]
MSAIVELRASKPSKWLNLTFFILCAAVVGYAWLSRAGQRYYDEVEYWEIAGHLARGQGFALQGQPTAYRPPAWPLILAPFHSLGSGIGVATMASVACLILAALAAGRLGMILTGQRLGSLAAIFVLAYPINIYTSATLYPQMLALLTTVVMWMLVAQAEAQGRLPWLWGCVLGLAAAVMTLAVPTLAFTAVALLAAGSWILWRRRDWPAIVAGWAAAGALMGAWAIRNWIVFREFIPISTSTGINLLIGNNPDATAGSGVDVDLQASMQRVFSMGLSENGRSSEFMREALHWITSNPGDAAMLYLQKTAHYFVAYDAPATAGQGKPVMGLIAWAALVVIAGLTVARWSNWGRRTFPMHFTERVMLFVFIANAPIMAVFFTRVRFRVPLDSFLLIEAAIGLLIVAYHFMPALRERAATT